MQILFDMGVKIKFVYETESSPFSPLQTVCQKNNVPFGRPTQREILELLDRIEEPTVIFSINNNYIFPPQVVEKTNLRIINFHNALLPYYRGHGLSIPPWIIFNGERRHGVTWHLIDEHLDTGRILCSDVFDVKENDTALTLAMRCIQRGIALFSKQLEAMLDFTFLEVRQDGQNNDIYKNPLMSHMYRKRELPNNGFLDTSWGFEECSRFLRSMDYGPYRLLPMPKIVIDNDTYLIKKYRVQELPPKKEGNRHDPVRLTFEEGEIVLRVEKEKRHG